MLKLREFRSSLNYPHKWKMEWVKDGVLCTIYNTSVYFNVSLLFWSLVVSVFGNSKESWTIRLFLHKLYFFNKYIIATHIPTIINTGTTTSGMKSSWPSCSFFWLPADVVWWLKDDEAAINDDVLLMLQERHFPLILRTNFQICLFVY